MEIFFFISNLHPNARQTTSQLICNTLRAKRKTNLASNPCPSPVVDFINERVRNGRKLFLGFIKMPRDLIRKVFVQRTQGDFFNKRHSPRSNRDHDPFSNLCYCCSLTTVVRSVIWENYDR